MKKSVLVVTVLLMIAVPSFATTSTTSVSIGIGGFCATDVVNGEGIVSTGLAFRYVTSPADVGFYFGIDVFTGMYLMGYDWDLSPFDVSIDPVGYWGSLHFNADIRMPFGYRFAAEGKGSGFYIGGGPEIDFMFEVDVMMMAGGFLELGWQTNKTEGIGFHFGMLIGYTPLYYRFGSGIDFQFFNPMLFHPTLEFGISWRRVKGPSASG